MSDKSLRTTIIVGAGSAGAVAAARLTEDASEQVVLVEAGPGFISTDQLPESLRDPEGPSLEGHDWGYRSFWTEPADRSEVGNYPRGKVLGGSSAVNATLAIRGVPQDYDDWGDLGLPEWSWDAVLPYFVKLENDLDFGAESYHGTHGPIPVQRTPMEDWALPLQRLVKAFAEHGIDFVEDLNAPDVIGVSPIPRNRINKVRASSAVTYLHEANGRPNLQIVADTMVVRVLIEDGRAVGVETERDGVRDTIRGDRVVLCGGAINSPHILMLSGIGPAEVLESLGIDVQLDLPGVGRNFQDHPLIPLVFASTDPGESRYGFPVLTRYSSGVDGGFPNDIAIPHGYTARRSMNFDLDDSVTAGIFVPVTLGKVRSAGWIDLVSADHRVQPELHLNFLDDDGDKARMAAGVRFMLEVLTSEHVADLIGDPLIAPDASTLANDERLDQWIREHVNTGYHGAGTCRMGPEGDELAVVDGRLRVHGIEGLYVADSSIMPTITTAYTNLTCYMIGERVANWLSEDQGEVNG